MISRKVLSDQIRDTLLDRILSGKYAPGERIVESGIAKEFAISQSPVREALRDLVAMRFVELSPHKGARVRSVSDKEILESYPVRAALEELAGRLAAKKFDGNVKGLEAIYDQMVQSAVEGSIQDLTRLDAQFHRKIISAANNVVLARTWESLMIESWTYVTAKKIIPSEMSLMTVVELHRPIIEALRAGDGERAAASMKAHICTFADLLEQEIRKDSTKKNASAS